MVHQIEEVDLVMLFKKELLVLVEAEVLDIMLVRQAGVVEVPVVRHLYQDIMDVMLY